MKKLMLVRRLGDVVVAITFVEAKEHDASRENLESKEEVTIKESKEKAPQGGTSTA